MSASQSPPQAAEAARPERVSTLRFLLTLAIAAWALRSLIVQPFHIPSGSMLPTLYIGDYLTVAKWPYGFSRYSFPFEFPPIRGRLLGALPKRGDVVVFHHPSEDSDLIKRVIGLPGDRIEVRNGQLVLNGRPVGRRPLPPAAIPISANSPCPASAPQRAGRCLYPAFLETLPGGPSFTVLDQVDHGPADDFAPVTVPAGAVFMMGDNRDDSLDSRFSTEVGGIGMVPLDHLIGRATATFWSTDGSADYARPWTWFQALRRDRLGNTYSGIPK